MVLGTTPFRTTPDGFPEDETSGRKLASEWMSKADGRLGITTASAVATAPANAASECGGTSMKAICVPPADRDARASDNVPGLASTTVTGGLDGSRGQEPGHSGRERALSASALPANRRNHAHCHPPRPWIPEVMGP